MTLLVWNESISVNHADMDADHRNLFKIINNLCEAMRMGQGETVLEKMLTNLEDYSKNHFSREEQFLRESNHPDLSIQIQQHKLFSDKVLDYKKVFQSGDKIIALEMLQFLSDWLVNHIIKVDMNYKVEFFQDDKLY